MPFFTLLLLIKLVHVPTWGLHCLPMLSIHCIYMYMAVHNIMAMIVQIIAGGYVYNVYIGSGTVGETILLCLIVMVDTVCVISLPDGEIMAFAPSLSCYPISPIELCGGGLDSYP